MKKVLITGISGFVGSNLKKYFELNELFLPLGLSLKSDNNLNWRNVENFYDCDAIIHLAGKAHDLNKTNAETEYYKINTDFTKEIYDIFLNSEVRTFIFLSSVKAVSDTVNGILKEEDTPNPKTHYGKSKLLAEEYILSKTIPTNKRVYILRPCMIHGPNNKGNLNLLFKFIKFGIPYPLGAFENLRSFLSVENLCFTIKELINLNNIPDGIYNVSDDTPISTIELTKIIGKSIGKKSKVWRVNKKLIYSFAKIGDFLYLPFFNTERLKKLTESYIVSNNKIVSALSQNLPISSINGLKITFDSFKKQ